MRIKDINFCGLKLDKVMVVRRPHGTDTIGFTFQQDNSSQSPYPELEKADPGANPPFFKMDCRHHYGVEWLATNLGVTPDDPDLTVV